MKGILAELKNNGWEILEEDKKLIWANRISTGKKAFFINQQDLSSLKESEILSIWKNKHYHPFIYQEVKGECKFFDFLFDEEVKTP